jgi:hypothetical protein
MSRGVGQLVLEETVLKSYPLGIAARIAIAFDCVRRGDLDGAASCLAQAARLSREGRPLSPRPAGEQGLEGTR